MSRQPSTSAAPEWAPADHDTRYSEACVVDPSRRPNWYFGRGLGPARHPLAELIPFQLLACGHCGGLYPWFDVVAAHHARDSNGGEGSWSTEFRCVLCRHYTRVSSSAA